MQLASGSSAASSPRFNVPFREIRLPTPNRGPSSCFRTTVRTKARRIVQTSITNEIHAAEYEFPDEALPTDSGYLPIDESSESRLFYVYYEASKPDTELEISPIMVWLNGGPGCSSLIGCFYELGPWILQENFSLQKNPGAWNRRCEIQKFFCSSRYNLRT
ncbi:hypothetical protein SELMODRAFT_417974 [Selaginella moellendorffii]|uniref:Uncharacterized protein n=1 Tax=Selaginella moellendorffii TaxID=88036 RepID=D8S494_SELML|nr:hypothetical protein SELMODRAFT_417974 [Selaginella moellendorffii]